MRDNSAVKDDYVKTRSSKMNRVLRAYRERAARPISMICEGKLSRMVGLSLEAIGCRVPIGGRCKILSNSGVRVEAEVVGFSGDRVFLMPISEIAGLTSDARVIPTQGMSEALVGDALLGRVIDGEGNVLDDKGSLKYSHRVPLLGVPINPLKRSRITQPLDVGVRSINALFSVGRGQRMGLFAGSGVGKSVLLGMMTRYTKADVSVVAMIGERGREVNEFVQKTLGEEGMKRAVVIATPADNPPLMRMHGAWLATAVAEYFRDQGKHVLLLMDSLTRFAQAQREISLAIGEPPATKGYTPSVFARIPQLVERAGTSEGSGTITAFYTVLNEGDDQNDPVADASRAILDGHIVLSRRIAETGLYPAIDVEASISRVMVDIVDDPQKRCARKFHQLYSMYEENRDLISVGAYRAGTDARVDEAIQYFPQLQKFIMQDMDASINYQQSYDELIKLLDIPDSSP